MHPSNTSTYKINEYIGQNKKFSISACRRHQDGWQHETDPAVNAIKNSLGLSTLHISPHSDMMNSSYTLEIAIGGTLVKVKGTKPSNMQPRRSSRGIVRGFSNASRRNLMHKLASIDREALLYKPLFVTLTYPRCWPEDPRQWKRDLDKWIKRLRRRYPECAAVWKLEPQKRGAPHYHLLVFNVTHLKKEWLAQTWYEVVGSNDVAHFQAGTRVESIRSWNGCMAYASKALGRFVHELPAGWEKAGKRWGVTGSKYLPIMILKIPIPRKKFEDLRSTLWRILGGQPPNWIQYENDGISALVDLLTLIKEYQKVKQSRIYSYTNIDRTCYPVNIRPEMPSGNRRGLFADNVLNNAQI